MTGPIPPNLPSVPYDASAYPPAPDISPTLPDGMPNPLALPRQTDQARKATKTRRELMAEAWAAYHGDFPDPLKPQQDGVNDNVKPNRCVAIVDTDADFLFGMPVKLEVGLPQDVQAKREKAAQARKQQQAADAQAA